MKTTVGVMTNRFFKTIGADASTVKPNSSVHLDEKS